MKPNIGDTVWVQKINRHSVKTLTSPTPEKVVKVGRMYFYTKSGKTFEINSFVDSAWCDKQSDIGYSHEFIAYPSIELYNQENRKSEMIDCMLSVNWIDLSYEDIQKIWSYINGEKTYETTNN